MLTIKSDLYYFSADSRNPPLQPLSRARTAVRRRGSFARTGQHFQFSSRPKRGRQFPSLLRLQWQVPAHFYSDFLQMFCSCLLLHCK